MATQLDELRAAVKAVAKARAEGRPIDLSTLPPEIRSKLEAQLAKLPPDARRQLEARGNAAIGQVAQRVADRVGPVHVHNAVIPRYSGHFNNTVKAGDATHVPWSWLFAVLVIGIAVWRMLG